MLSYYEQYCNKHKSLHVRKPLALEYTLEGGLQHIAPNCDKTYWLRSQQRLHPPAALCEGLLALGLSHTVYYLTIAKEKNVNSAHYCNHLWGQKLFGPCKSFPVNYNYLIFIYFFILWEIL